MNDAPPTEYAAAAPVPAPGPVTGLDRAAAAPRTSRLALTALLGVSVLALGLSAALWQRLGTIQEQLARQSADAGANAIEARALARQAQELARDTAARQALADGRLSEVALQRTQLEALMQTLSRSRDDTLVVDIESSLRLAHQQAQLTLSPEPLLAALRVADQRLASTGEPRLARVRAAIGRDIDRIKAASVTDVPGLLVKIDEVVRLVDDLPLANAVGMPRSSTPAPDAPPTQWWRRWADAVGDEARRLVRVSRIDRPDAVLVAPEQAFFLRENLKLRLLNARLSLLARQTEAARADVAVAAQALFQYFDPAARRTQQAAGVLQQVQGQLRTVELPRVDETLAMLATAAAGR